ncbi:hypothetical protein CesoFtcFv8_027794 [Champsocephalus esox]|nr:hypothetical protein CesoFtcFv8_027794 [Champsocephalus esox]
MVQMWKPPNVMQRGCGRSAGWNVEQLDVLAWQMRLSLQDGGTQGRWEGEIPPSLICENLEVGYFPRIFCDEAMESVPWELSL